MSQMFTCIMNSARKTGTKKRNGHDRHCMSILYLVFTLYLCAIGSFVVLLCKGASSLSISLLHKYVEIYLNLNMMSFNITKFSI